MIYRIVQQTMPQSSIIIRRLLAVLFITSLYFCGRTYFEYKGLKLAKELAETTALAPRAFANEAAFMDKLQHIIRDEVRALQTRERLKSEKLISRLAEEYKSGTEEKRKFETEAAHRKTDSAFSFRVHLNFSRLFDLF